MTSGEAAILASLNILTIVVAMGFFFIYSLMKFVIEWQKHMCDYMNKLPVWQIISPKEFEIPREKVELNPED